MELWLWDHASEMHVHGRFLLQVLATTTPPQGRDLG
jgi:hypothetical protein